MLVARDDWTKKITHSSIIRPSIAEYKYTQKFKRGRKKKECQKHKRKSFTNLVRRRRQYRSKEKERGNPKKKKKTKENKKNKRTHFSASFLCRVDRVLNSRGLARRPDSKNLLKSITSLSSSSGWL